MHDEVSVASSMKRGLLAGRRRFPGCGRVLGASALRGADFDDARSGLFRRRCRRGWIGHQVAFEPRQFVIGKIDRQAPLLCFSVTRLKSINIVPSIGVKWIGQQRRAENETDLFAALARFKLRHHFLSDKITLAHIDAIRGQPRGDLRQAGAPGQSGQGKQGGKNNSLHGRL